MLNNRCDDDIRIESIDGCISIQVFKVSILNHSKENTIINIPISDLNYFMNEIQCLLAI